MTAMSIAQIQDTKRYWPRVSATLHIPHNEAEYRELVALLDSLVDEVGEDETHALASLMELISVLIERYEDQHIPELRA